MLELLPNRPPAAGVLFAPPNRLLPELPPADCPPNKELPVAGALELLVAAPPKRFGFCAPLFEAAFPNRPAPLD